jgi:hypothetical protein
MIFAITTKTLEIGNTKKKRPGLSLFNIYRESGHHDSALSRYFTALSSSFNYSTLDYFQLHANNNLK